MLVSVVMSIYNESVDFIEKSVNSILAQTYKNFEFIIVIDNPENVGSIELLKQKQLMDSRIVLIENDRNVGLSKSLNKAIKQSKGQYIFRMDADDISVADRIERQLAFMNDHNLDMSSCLIKKIDQNEDIIYVQKSYKSDLNRTQLAKLSKYRCIMSHPTWCVKREVYLALDFYRDLVPVEDYDFILRALEKNYNLGILNDYLLYYRDNISGISNTQVRKQRLMSTILKKNYGRLNEIQEDIIKEMYLKEESHNYTDFDYYEQFRNKLLCKEISIKALLKIILNIQYLKLFIDDLRFILLKKYYKI
ncbi:TPA: glycosyltransferase [Streptococcus suis]|nr:glycosyltransferase [Streptococcus suis]